MGKRKTKPEGRPKGIIETKPRETLKRKRFAKEMIKALNNNKPDTIQSLSHKAGYSKNSRKMYSQGTKWYIKEKMKELGASLDDCEKFFIYLRELAMEEKDRKEARENNVNLVRMQGGFTDKTEAKIEVKHPEAYKEAVNNRLLDNDSSN